METKMKTTIKDFRILPWWEGEDGADIYYTSPATKKTWYCELKDEKLYERLENGKYTQKDLENLKRMCKQNPPLVIGLVSH